VRTGCLKLAEVTLTRRAEYPPKVSAEVD
jgi:hypothetical protein